MQEREHTDIVFCFGLKDLQTCMSNIRISVIMPVYNAEKHLKTSIESVLKQSYTDFELIIVDDGSKDSSGKICDEFALSDSRIKVIHQQNSGVSKARNTGIAVSTGDYIVFLDSDDEMDPNLIEDNLKLVEKYDPDVLIFNFRYVFSDHIEDNDYKQDKVFFDDGRKFFEEKLETVVEKELMNAPWNKIIRSELVKKNNILFDERFSIFEDAMFSVSVCTYAKTVCVNSNIYHSYYIWDTGSLRTKWTDSRFCAIKELYKLEKRYCSGFENNKKQICFFNKLFSKSIFVYMQQISVTQVFPYKKKKKLLKDVCNDEKVRQIFLNKNYYPDSGFNKGAIRICVKLKLTFMIIFLYRLKNIFRRK
ncbi:MAG: glycosyltransferase family 2 protein [Lachnospiraceae bacterium]|nr:glycosyltransferase family 2 protein [Lachnospiraceae bacterium]